MLVAFALSVIFTVWMLLAHNHMHHVLHIVHVTLITLTFLLIALYLMKSAEIASLAAYRELRRRLAVDRSVALIEYLPEEAPIFNACAGALAKSGIYVKSPAALKTLSALKTVAADGNSPEREGYEITKQTLWRMGVELSDDTEGAPISIVLGELDPGCDIVITQNKITQLLKAVYISRLYVACLKFTRLFLSGAALAAAILLAFGMITYAAAAITLWSATVVLTVKRIERRTTRMTFAQMYGN
jgi:cation transport ATPase